MMEAVKIEYKLNVSVPAAAVAELFRRAGLNRPVDDLRRMAAMLANANHIMTAWEGVRPVQQGFQSSREGNDAYSGSIA